MNSIVFVLVKDIHNFNINFVLVAIERIWEQFWKEISLGFKTKPCGINKNTKIITVVNLDLTLWGHFTNKWNFQLCLLFNSLKLEEIISDYGIKMKMLQQRQCNFQKVIALI